MAYRYHVVPFIGRISSGVFSTDSAQTVSTQLQAVIDHYVGLGWEFYSMEKVDIEVTPGCLGGLLGKSASFITFDQIILRQPV